MLLRGFRERTENDAEFGQLLFERSGHGNAVENCVNGNTCKPLLLFKRNAQLLIRA